MRRSVPSCGGGDALRGGHVSPLWAPRGGGGAGVVRPKSSLGGFPKPRASDARGGLPAARHSAHAPAHIACRHASRRPLRAARALRCCRRGCSGCEAARYHEHRPVGHRLRRVWRAPRARRVRAARRRQARHARGGPVRCFLAYLGCTSLTPAASVTGASGFSAQAWWPGARPKRWCVPSLWIFHRCLLALTHALSISFPGVRALIMITSALPSRANACAIHFMPDVDVAVHLSLMATARGIAASSTGAPVGCTHGSQRKLTLALQELWQGPQDLAVLPAEPGGALRQVRRRHQAHVDVPRAQGDARVERQRTVREPHRRKGRLLQQGAMHAEMLRCSSA